MNVDESIECGPTPGNRPYKTIGLGPCRRCGELGCWRFYLEWEKRVGITLNAELHHLVE